MNLRTYIVKALYPLCSDEVQIMLDQMRNNPDKFTQMIDNTPYRVSDNPWYRAMQSDNFELIDHVALRQQLKLLKVTFAKQLILEGLMTNKELDSNREANLNMFDSITGAPSKIHMNRAQMDIAKKFMEEDARKHALDAAQQSLGVKASPKKARYSK